MSEEDLRQTVRLLEDRIDTLERSFPRFQRQVWRDRRHSDLIIAASVGGLLLLVLTLLAELLPANLINLALGQGGIAALVIPAVLYVVQYLQERRHE